MLKRLLQTCAAAALLASSAFAGNASGTYTAQTADGKLVLELQPLQDDLLRGTVHYGSKDYPLVAKQTDDNVNGTWECQGRHIPFTSSLSERTLTLTTNGATYTLEKSAAAGFSTTNDAPDNRPNVPQQAANAQVQPMATREGRAFRYAVPQGWQAAESSNGVDLASPDGTTAVSHALLVSPGHSKPDEVLDLILAQAETMKWTDVKVESATPCNKGTALGTSYMLNYRVNGKAVHAMVVIIVFNEDTRNVARVVVLQATPEVFARDGQKLMDLAHKVEVTHPNLVAGNESQEQQQPQEQQPQEPTPTPTPEVDPKEPEAINRDYLNREQRMDEINRRFQDAIRERE